MVGHFKISTSLGGALVLTSGLKANFLADIPLVTILSTGGSVRRRLKFGPLAGSTGGFTSSLPSPAFGVTLIVSRTDRWLFDFAL